MRKKHDKFMTSYSKLFCEQTCCNDPCNPMHDPRKPGLHHEHHDVRGAALSLQSLSKWM